MKASEPNPLPSMPESPLAAALRAASVLPTPEPVQAVDYASAGKTLIIGAATLALTWAERLKELLDVSVLATAVRGDEAFPVRDEYPVHIGSEVKVTGWLGSFDVRWMDDAQAPCSERFDMVFDLSAEPLIRLPHPPQGYLAGGADPLQQYDAALRLTGFVGEFDKPRYFSYKADQCAHSRNRIEGCRNCIDLCSTGAISAKGDGIVVEPHLCMGCGACASACPSGAMRYAFPPVPDLGLRIKTMLAAYAKAGGSAPTLLVHERKGEELWLRLEQRAQLPDGVIPLGVHDVAAIGPDLMLAALCYGATHVAVLHPADMPSAYFDNLQRQMALAQTLVNGLGYAGAHYSLLAVDTADALSVSLNALSRAPLGVPAAGFNLFTDKRRTLDFCIDYLLEHAPQKCEEIALQEGAPFGTLTIDASRCTLCMACVGACPSKALQDNPELPQLRFIEHNCVQCGICVDTCPEHALGKQARLLLTPAAKQPRVLNEAQPFHCVRCAKPFGTRAMVESMLQRLSGHALFADERAQRRLQMCGDCRVVDMMENPKEMTVEDLRS